MGKILLAVMTILALDYLPGRLCELKGNSCHASTKNNVDTKQNN